MIEGKNENGEVELERKVSIEDGVMSVSTRVYIYITHCQRAFFDFPTVDAATRFKDRVERHIKHLSGDLDLKLLAEEVTK